MAAVGGVVYNAGSNPSNKLGIRRITMPCPGDPGPRPAFIPTPDTARAVFKYTSMGQIIENVFYFYIKDGWSLPLLVDLGVHLTSAWDTFLKPRLNSAIELLDITITNVELQNGDQTIAPVNAAGTLAGQAFPSTGQTFAIKFGTGIAGRSYRGRMYWPLLSNDAVANGNVNQASAVAMVGAVDDFFAQIKTDMDADHVVVSYQGDCEWRAAGIPTPVTSYTYSDLHLDSQRRRLPGRGI
jgi:hypothetical protein